jgi:hypothetical protein
MYKIVLNGIAIMKVALVVDYWSNRDIGSINATFLEGFSRK